MISSSSNARHRLGLRYVDDSDLKVRVRVRYSVRLELGLML